MKLYSNEATLRTALRLSAHFDKLGYPDLADISDEFIQRKLAQVNSGDDVSPNISSWDDIPLAFLESQTPNQLFGVGDKVSAKKGYRDYSRRYHPDVNKHPLADDAFKLGQHAMDRIHQGFGDEPLGGEGEGLTGLGIQPDQRSLSQSYDNRQRDMGIRLTGKMLKELYSGNKNIASVYHFLLAEQIVTEDKSQAFSQAIQQARAQRDAIKANEKSPEAKSKATELGIQKSWRQIISLFSQKYQIPIREELGNTKLGL